MSRRLLEIVVALGLCLQTHDASAVGADTYHVAYRGGPHCPSEDELLADVAAHVRDLSRSAGVRIDLRVAREPSGFSGELISTDASGFQGTRRIQGRTCTEVVHALAFLAALAIELGGRVEPSISTPAPIARPLLLEQAAHAPAEPADGGSLPVVSVVALGELRSGLGPTLHPSVAVGIELGLAKPRTIDPSLRLLLVASDGRVSSGDRSADLALLGARLEGCALRLGSSSLAVRGCADAEIGALLVTRNTAPVPERPTEVWATLGVSAIAEWRVTPSFFIVASGGPDVALVRTRYSFGADETAYVSPAVTGHGGIGLGLRL
jgi:hypothetical protein